MICPTCYGKGQFTQRQGNRAVYSVCPSCYGSGVVHCCDGERASPDLIEFDTPYINKRKDRSYAR